MAADAATIAGAEVTSLPDDLRTKLAGMLPAFASLNNPLDMTGGASFDGKLMADCLREVLAHASFDAALLCVNLIWREGKVLLDELAQVAALGMFAKPYAGHDALFHGLPVSFDGVRAGGSEVAPKIGEHNDRG